MLPVQPVQQNRQPPRNSPEDRAKRLLTAIRTHVDIPEADREAVLAEITKEFNAQAMLLEVIRKQAEAMLRGETNGK